MIQVQLLGPPRVLRDEVPVGFDTRKALALLACLALTDVPRPRDTLAELLWPETDLDRSRGALRRTLSSLRSGIGADRVVATRDHVSLVRDCGVSVDVDRFRTLRARGDLDEAVAAFRGDLLEGFAVRGAPEFEAWLDGEAEALRLELMETLAELAAARESAGDLPAAVTAARRWVSLDPLHEPAHQALIRLCAASGDRAGAVAQYRACVGVLSRELGVAPLTATTDLYEAASRGVTATTASPRVAAVSPGDRGQGQGPVPTGPAPEPAFVGRDGDLASLVAAHRGVRSEGRVALVEGESGIGKSRLVQELLGAVRGAGAVVLTGRCYEDEVGLAFGPVGDLLRDRLREDDAWLRKAGEGVLTEAARLLPELVKGQRVPPPGSFDQPGAEGHFLAAVWDLLTLAVAGTAPGVVVLDDAQWADEATLRLLAYGIRRLAGRPLLVVLGWRTPHDHPVRHAAVAAAQSGGSVHVRLGRLGEESVAEMVRSVRLGAVDPSVVRRVWQATEGVPLRLVELLRTDGDSSTQPTGAREMVSARLGRISEQGRQVLTAAAVLGRPFDPVVARAVSGRSDDETATALRELEGQGVLRRSEGDFDFEHELLRVVVYDETSLARRRLLHGRAAEAIGGPPAVVGRHLQLAGREADAARAFLEAGEQARALFGHDEALRHVRTALGLGHPDRTRLRLIVEELETRLGDYAGALVSLETAAAGCAPDELAGVEHRLGRLHHRRGEYALAQAHLLSALDGTADADLATRAQVTADLSLANHALGGLERARSLARAAVALAEQARDPRVLGQAYNLLGMVGTGDGDTDTDEAMTDLGRARQIAEDLDDTDLRVAVLNNLALAHRTRGALDQALELTTQALELCGPLGDRHREAALHNNLADLLQASGRGQEAMVHLKAAARIFTDIGVEEQPLPEIWKLVRW